MPGGPALKFESAAIRRDHMSLPLKAGLPLVCCLASSEYAAVHKDISVLTGDGKPGAEDRLNTDRSGCNADFRYYEGADNFDVAKSISYAKITLKGRTLTVKIDPRADGKFQVKKMIK